MSRSNFPVTTLSELATLLGTTEPRLSHLANNAEKLYSRRKEPKASGGFRTISSPKPQLKEIQRKLHKCLFSQLGVGPFAHCGIKKRSNITNACAHAGSDVIFTFDLKSFFPSVRPERVKTALIDEFGCPPTVASLITRLVTADFELPQGAPTSTDIANIVTIRLQRRLYPLAKQWGVKNFTIYADDISFSSNNVPEGFQKMTTKVVGKEGFKIHPDKGGVFDKSQSQVVTGINNAHGSTVGKRKKKWRAERYQNAVRHRKGEISDKEFEASEKRYASRVVYASSVKKLSRKVAELQ